ncbi:MAG: ABC transporter ATP-binding protein [Thermodesulfobacteriota bacterium]
MNEPAEKKAKPVTGDTSLLTIDSVSRAFGGVQALSDITFSIENEAITGLIGPNGAGKTTLFNLITGVFPADAGTIDFNGKSIANTQIHELVRIGIARTFQNVELFQSMTVLENVLVGLHTRTRCGMIGSLLRPPKVGREEKQAWEKAMELLDFVGLSGYADRCSGDLPFGWQRLLELARALAARPRLLLLDEPAAGLNMSETGQLGDLIQQIRSQGVSVLLVEHDMNLTMTVSDRIVVLDQGRKIAEGTPRQIQADQAVMAAYLGQPKDENDAGRPEHEPAFSVNS